jgi:hypothetical protein
MRKLSYFLIALVLLNGCGTWNLFRRSSTDEYSTAVVAYKTKALAYKAAGDEISALRGASKVTDVGWARFVVAQADVRAADTKAYTLLQAWKVNGGKRIDKPPGMDAALRDLSAAQDKVILQSAEVNL